MEQRFEKLPVYIVHVFSLQAHKPYFVGPLLEL